MLALRPKQRPPLPVAQAFLASVFGVAAVKASGLLFPKIEARGTWRGRSVRVELEMSNTRRSTEPFTTIEVEEDFDVAVYTGGAAWAYPSWEPFALFRAPRLARKAAVGAPRALLPSLIDGVIADRLAASGLCRLSIGSEARRDGCATRGVHLVVEGWPLDPTALHFLLDTVVGIATETRRELSGGVWARGGRHPEMVPYEIARQASRKQGLKVVAGIFVALTMITVLTISLLACS